MEARNTRWGQAFTFYPLSAGTTGGSNCLDSSVWRGDFWVPRRIVFQHRIDDDQRFSHAGNARDFLGFTCTRAETSGSVSIYFAA